MLLTNLSLSDHMCLVLRSLMYTTILSWIPSGKPFLRSCLPSLPPLLPSFLRDTRIAPRKGSGRVPEGFRKGPEGFWKGPEGFVDIGAPRGLSFILVFRIQIACEMLPATKHWLYPMSKHVDENISRKDQQKDFAEGSAEGSRGRVRGRISRKGPRKGPRKGCGRVSAEGSKVCL